MAIVPAGSPAFLDVQDAYSKCNNGDTLTIPKGTAIWGANDFLTVTKAIQIIGFGIDPTAAIPSTTPGSINATIITVTNTTGKFIQATYPASGIDFTSRISGIVLELTTKGSGYLFSLQGKAYRHRDANNNIVGGLRVDHIRVRNSADSGTFPIAGGALLFTWGGPTAGNGTGTYVTGSFDHNFIDYQVGSMSSEVNNFACAGSPDSSLPDGWGQYNWCQNYTHGGGDDTELQVIYVEDNIFHKGGFNLGTLAGGARLIVRHNTSWGGLNGHGMETGGNMGPASWEVYNNNIIRQTAFNAAAFNWRGGAIIHTNNRTTGYGGNNQPPPLALQISRPSNTNSAIVGNGSGRNFFDENYRDNPLTIPQSGGGSVNFGATSTPTDARIGAVYASGNGCTVLPGVRTYALNGLDGTKGGQSNAGNVWAGFCLINTSACSDPTDAVDPKQGEQGSNTSAENLAYGLILTSDNNASNCTVTVEGSGGSGSFNFTAGSTWQIRRVKTYFCVPGSGKIPFLMNGGNNLNILPNTGIFETTGAAFIPEKVGAPGQHKYWSGQFGFGLWQKGNLARPDSGTQWANASGFTGSTGVPAGGVAGGIHDEAVPPYKKNDGTGGVAYPFAPLQDAAHLRIGADWNAPGYSENINVGDPGALNGTTLKAYGAVYPNPMVGTTVLPAPVINSPLIASSTIGSSFSYFITASNSPTSYGATQLPAGYAVNASTGEISCTAAANIGQPSDYSVLISATNTGGTGSGTLVITLSGTASTQRGKGRAHRIATAARRM